MKIRSLLVMPGKEVQTVKIPASVKFIKALIGKDLITLKLNKNTMLIANNNAGIDEFNRIYKGDIILGTFLIISTKNNRRVSMKKKDIRKFTNMFKLKKHKKKIELYKEEYLEEFYTNQRIRKQKNAEANKGITLRMAA